MPAALPWLSRCIQSIQHVNRKKKKDKSNLHSLNFALKQYKKNEFSTMYLNLKTPLTKIMKVISHLGLNNSCKSEEISYVSECSCTSESVI